MKIIEAMNELKLTEKKLNQKLRFIQQYAARPSFRDDAFADQKEKTTEAKKVAQAVQSANDLIQRHEDLKRALDYTNLTTKVKVGKADHSIHSLILHKRFLCKLKAHVYQSLNDATALREVEELRRRQSDGKVNQQVVYNYDIQDREDKLEEIMTLQAEVDSALQIANAKLDLKEAPKL